jgi:hypothetical protein
MREHHKEELIEKSRLKFRAIALKEKYHYCYHAGNIRPV